MREWDGMDLTDAERRLAEELTALGPLIGQAAQAMRQEPDPAFLLSLRASLVQIEPKAPTRAFEERLRRRLVGLPPAIYRPVGVVSALVLAAVVVIILLRGGTARPTQRPLAAGIPRPATPDLIFGFPVNGVSGGGGGFLTPMTSRIDVNGGSGYPARLHLRLGQVSNTATTLPVYRLAGRPPFASALAASAHRLGITGSAICMSAETGKRVGCAPGAWRVVAQHRFPSRLPLKSLAFSTATGETLYHNTTYDPIHYRGPALKHGRATTLALGWLAASAGRQRACLC